MNHQELTALDEVVHQRTRLAVLATLVEMRRADFGTLKKDLALTDGNCGKHIRILEDAGYVAVQKAYEGRRPRTWVAITPKGAEAYAREIAMLRSLVDAAAHEAARANRQRRSAAAKSLQPQIV